MDGVDDRPGSLALAVLARLNHLPLTLWPLPARAPEVHRMPVAALTLPTDRPARVPLLALLHALRGRAPVKDPIRDHRT